MSQFLSWLQERIKSWIKPATPVLIIDLFSDLTHSRTDQIVENALLRQQLIILKRQVKRPQLSNLDRIRLVLFPTLRNFGNKPFTLFSQIHSCVGIGICFAIIGAGSPKVKTNARTRYIEVNSCWAASQLFLNNTSELIHIVSY